jgi:hypothetical protein
MLPAVRQAKFAAASPRKRFGIWKTDGKNTLLDAWLELRLSEDALRRK